MKKNILDYLEEQVKNEPDKSVFEEAGKKITYCQFQNEAKKIGTGIIKYNIKKGKVAIYLDKGIDCLTAMFGIMYSNSVYCVLDTRSPMERINKILDILSPQMIITDNKHAKDITCNTDIKTKVVLLEELKEQNTEEHLLDSVIEKSIDTDPVYILFTSGSTGTPKGTIVSHRSVINYAETIAETFNLDSKVVFGSQTPFYFSMSVLDIFVTIRTGGKLVIIPKMLFSFPVKLIEFLNTYQVNTIYWVPTAISIVANYNTFSVIIPKCLTKILFAGEVMPVKQLNYWIAYLPNCLFANLYGPTEITDTGTYYIVNRIFNDNEALPIGVPFKNSDVILLNDNNEPVKEGEEGEICFRGSFLGYGYYNNWEKTSQAFCQNPLNTHYREFIYRTGDIGKYNEYGEILYISRKDFQIKRMGYRIELGEIENDVGALPEVQNCVCIYDQDSMKIILYYVGNIQEEAVRGLLQEKLVRYMWPDSIFKVKSIPINANGKYDRQLLMKEYRGREG
ncbi:MAG: AMP-binding protein [Roseburia sp.]|nr:AMP-binding protein [Roseburia sp.]